ncbi:MAG TPA: EpsI family protein [Thermoguttaceae bacterium]|nr:EpsI family protein [Thermoguttaceae bacterium]
MTNPVTRLLIAIAVVVVVYAGSYAVQGALETPEVILPDRDFNTLPVQLGQWHGKDVALDPEVFVNTDAKRVVQREYRDNQGHALSLFLALYDEPDKGVYHSPMNCYRANGWQKIEDNYRDMECEAAPTIPIRVTTWEKDGKHEMVIYWYRLGEHTLFSRYDMGDVRIKMAGKKAWPAMIKVLLQTSSGASGSAESDLYEFAKLVHQWVEAEPQGQAETDEVLANSLEDPVPSQ